MSSKCIVKIVLLINIICAVNGQFNKELEGNPAGFLSDCPNKTAPISKQDLVYLQLVVHGAGSQKRTRYNYFQARRIAKDPNVDWSKKLVISVGGYSDSAEFLNSRLIEQAYFEKGYNVILLEAMPFVFHEYPIVARRIRVLAKHVAEMLIEVYKAGVMDPSRVEMVGLSLGGHTMGYIAKNFYQKTGKKIGKLVGLDPSGPCFRNVGPEDRLNATDGELVVVIHTNIDGLGIATPIGHVDFYVNGGEFQVDVLPFLSFCGATCSHLRSFNIWLAAVMAPESSFIGVKCGSVHQARFRQCYDNTPLVTNELGWKTDKNEPGIFYLATTHAYPYHLGKKGLMKGADPIRSLFNVLNNKVKAEVKKVQKSV